MLLVLVLKFYVALLYGSRNVNAELCNFTVNVMKHFAWDKDQMSPLEFHLSLCTLRCNGTDIVDVGKERNQSLSQYECSYCHCKKPFCERSDTCCPDILAAHHYPNLADGYGYILNINKSNHIGKLDGEEFLVKYIRRNLGCFMNKIHFPIKRTCLPDYQDNVTVEYLCEADLSTEEESLETYIKVLDNSTHVVYKNKFCALCNRVSQVTSLKTTLRFEDHRLSYSAKSFDELLRLQLESQTFLKELIVVQPFEFPLECFNEKVDMYKVCLKHKEYQDLDLLKACAQLSSKGFIVRDRERDKFFNNIFCAICDFNRFPLLLIKEGCQNHQIMPSKFPELQRSKGLNVFPESIMLESKKEHKNKINPSECLEPEWSAPDEIVMYNECLTSREKSNLDFAKACAQLSSKSLVVRDRYNDLFYNKIFCAICHYDRFPLLLIEHGCHKHPIMPSKFPELQRSIELNFFSDLNVIESKKEDEFKINQSECLETEWYAPDGSCLPIYCTEGKHLRDDECVEIIKDVVGIEYNLNMMFVLDNEDDYKVWLKFQTDYSHALWIEFFTLQLEVQLQLLDSKYIIATALKEGNDPCRMENAKGKKSQVIFITHGTVVAPVSMSRTQFEKKIIKNLLRPILRINVSPTEFVQLEPIVILRESVFGKLYLKVLCEFNEEHIVVYYYYHNNKQEIQKSVRTLQNEREDVLFLMKVNTYHLDTIYTRPYERNNLHVSQILFCKFLSFNQSDYQMTINDSVIPPEVRITINLNVTEVHITDNTELIMVDINKNGGLDVCTDLLDMKLKGHNN